MFDCKKVVVDRMAIVCLIVKKVVFNWHVTVCLIVRKSPLITTVYLIVRKWSLIGWPLYV